MLDTSKLERKYKVLSIKSKPPTYKKNVSKYWGTLNMMLPPTGSGTGEIIGFTPSSLEKYHVSQGA